MKQAVIATGGKQYLVAPGQTVSVERLPEQEGETVVFDQVLAVVDGEQTVVGKPQVKEAKVTGKVVSQYRTKKVIVEKFKSKKRYHRFGTHRQDQTEVIIESIA